MLRLARALLSFGAPSHRIEGQLHSAGEILRVNAAFVHLPSLIVVTFMCSDTRTSETQFVRASGRVALTKLHRVHLVYRDAHTTYNFELEDRVQPTVWHSDVSYELQPPGLTTFFLLAQPHTGGDTLFTSQISTLKKLSPAFIAFLKTLKAVHSGVEQADFSRSGRRGGVVRRDPVEHVHPVVRRHPVTGEEALYINKQFTRRIVELKKEESGASLGFLASVLDRY